jgi:P27 family predicted phage terminase small subunit
MPCQLSAGWGTANDIGPCKWHEGQEPIDFGEPPEFVLEHLPERAQEFWRMMAPDLAATDRLRTEDLAAFMQLAMAYHFCLESGDLIVKDGLTKQDPTTKNALRKHPAFQMWHQSVGVLRSLACEFGMTASSRERLQLPQGPDPENPWSGF